MRSDAAAPTHSSGRRAIGSDRPRLVVLEELTLSTTLDPYLSLRTLSQYSGCSTRWLRDRLTDPHHPLPYYRLPGRKILVRRSEFDAWLARYRQVGQADVDRIVAETLQSLAPSSRVPLDIGRNLRHEVGPRQAAREGGS